MQDADSSNDKQFLQERERRPVPIQWSQINEIQASAVNGCKFIR